MKVTLQDIQAAQTVLAPLIQSTELSYSNNFSKKMGHKVFLKFENAQLTGSFKIRGALNKMIALSEKQKRAGVIACSAGNHAQGVAYAGTSLGISTHVVMPLAAPLVKIEATRDYGAEVILQGDFFDQAYAHARKLEAEKGYVFVHPYEDPHVIAGQGTIGLEIFAALPDVDNVIVPIGGGGLISGIATALKALKPSCKIIGVQSEKTPGMANMFHAQKPVEGQKSYKTIADGIAVKTPSEVMYKNFIAPYVDDVVTVDDNEIAVAIVYLLERAKAVVEGAGAAALAAGLAGKLNLSGNTCFILSGGNIDLNLISKIIEKGLGFHGRLTNISVIIEDLPGNLHALTQILAEQKANIVQVSHDRFCEGLFLRETKVDFLLETTGPQHVEAIRLAIASIGGRIQKGI